MIFSIHHYDGSDRTYFLSRIEIMAFLAQFYKFRVSKIYQKIERINGRSWNRFLNAIHRERISINRIIKIEYLCVSRCFEIIYKKRHYGNEGFYYYNY